jgi:hypothetical protein
MMKTRNYLLIGFLSSLSISVAAEALGASPVEDVEEHFASLDRDGSRSLSRAEIGSFHWVRDDADDDGTVSRAEFIAGRSADRQRATAADRTERAWDLLDWNHDDFLSGTGRVTRQEFLGGDAPPKNPGNTPVPNDGVALTQAGKSLWGRSLGEAKKSDLFTFFKFEPLEGVVALKAGSIFDFRPKAPAFRDLVLVRVIVDGDQGIKGIELQLARSFIEHPQNGRFARDIAKSCLSQMTPAPDSKQVADLINEVQYGGTENCILFNRAPIPQLPNPPTPGYEAFLALISHHIGKCGEIEITASSGVF